MNFLFAGVVSTANGGILASQGRTSLSAKMAARRPFEVLNQPGFQWISMDFQSISIDFQGFSMGFEPHRACFEPQVMFFELPFLLGSISVLVLVFRADVHLVYWVSLGLEALILKDI